MKENSVLPFGAQGDDCARPPRPEFEPSGQKIVDDGHLPDLGVKVADLGFMVPAGVTVRKHRAQTIQRLALPAAHLVRMHLVPGRDLLDRLVAPQRIKRHAGLELSRKSSSCRHLVFLR